MRLQQIIVLIILVSVPTKMFPQSSQDDFFPLAVGNQWTYSYFDDEADYVVGTRTVDSGVVAYSILSKSTSLDSIVWAFLEARQIWRSFTPWASP